MGLLLVLAIPILLVIKYFEKPIERSKSEVGSILEKMAMNDTDDHLWDDFLSIPIKNRKLDKIRERVEVLWAYEDFQVIDGKGTVQLNKRGLSDLRKIIADLERV